ncbi:helix-turn-helix domain-containing protein [Aliarcobacter cryaerophilus]|uniref:helix-turn-helix domain-containing protein n=1 Tax=Aliarcobacter cryaerophilus TaxID=28198 RepID=UPI0021B52A44|nr:helix-turn-helix transcriptional regulator [Aliarcobacter cryaerophilus]MCT7493424.1 helix-turn-helix domain-containing protein [Aliarcobacter cryaerophilus]MCT7521108.1 helix-turn-helix domain-containing protein [Aliarcobacter cryaerophilus]
MQIDFKDFTQEELDNFYKLIGNNVKKVRQSKNITQMQLANAIGHNSVGHIAKAELNKYGKHFSIENLYKISKILDVPVSIFFEEL